jgi:hypothetical protein
VIRGGTELVTLVPEIRQAIDDGNYAVEFEARSDGVGHFPDQQAAFGLMLRNSSVAVWRAGFAAGELFIVGEPRTNSPMAINLLLARAAAHRAWQPGADWHLPLRGECQPVLPLVDGETQLVANSPLYADGRTTGLWVSNAAIRIRAYRLYET